ncbi:UNVERIFIED_CONTAM: hypothetical protein FKN15_056512 [Acipenser sinensis]
MSQSVAMNMNVFLRSLMKTLAVLSLMRLAKEVQDSIARSNEAAGEAVSAIKTVRSFATEDTEAKRYDSKLSDTQRLKNSRDTIRAAHLLLRRRLAKEVQDSIARSNEAAGEAVSAIKTVRSFATEDTEAKRYDSKLSDTQRLKNSRDTIRAAHLLLRRLISLAVQVVMLYYGRCLIKAGEMSTGSLVAFILYQRELGSHIRALVYICSNMLNSVGAAAKVFEYLDRRPLVSTDGSLQPETLRGHVQFKNVSFTYPSRPDVPVIKQICECGADQGCSIATVTVTEQICECGADQGCSIATVTVTEQICECGADQGCSIATVTVTEQICECGADQGCSIATVTVTEQICECGADQGCSIASDSN